jgi:hypothetical protein
MPLFFNKRAASLPILPAPYNNIFSFILHLIYIHICSAAGIG